MPSDLPARNLAELMDVIHVVLAAWSGLVHELSAGDCGVPSTIMTEAAASTFNCSEAHARTRLDCVYDYPGLHALYASSMQA